MTFRSPLGTSDFRQLRLEGATYVDKTYFIHELLQDTTRVVLFPRPRRFGKTLNLSALRYFTEKSDEDLSTIFSDLAIWQEPDSRQHFQKYPVIFLTFKDIKKNTWDGCLASITELLSNLCAPFRYLLDSQALTLEEKLRFSRLLDRTADLAEYETILRDLSKYLADHHHQQVIILIDEYDTPIHAGYTHRYYDDVVSFCRNFLSGGLKDNKYLFKGVLTGILRVAKEGIFSGLNNVIVHSFLSAEYSTTFGFTEKEVSALAAIAGEQHNLASIQRWYNGYLFGEQVIYNPWSVLSYFRNPRAGFSPYWINTSSNDILRQLLLDQGLGLKGELQTLLSGGSVVKSINDDIVLRDLDMHFNAIWSFLLFSGYLKASNVNRNGRKLEATLSVPNLEVQHALENMVEAWVQVHLGTELEPLLEGLLKGERQLVQDLLQNFLLTSVSAHDFAGKAPEQLYHAFFLGLLISLRPIYEVTSNRESGYGRYDLMVAPTKPGQGGVVIELKTVEKTESLEQAVHRAFAQLDEKQYRAVLQQKGASPLWEWVFAFDGKQVLAGARSF